MSYLTFIIIIIIIITYLGMPNEYLQRRSTITLLEHYVLGTLKYAGAWICIYLYTSTIYNIYYIYIRMSQKRLEMYE